MAPLRRPDFQIAALWLVFALSILSVSCGGGSKSTPTVTLQSISVTPANGTVAAGLTQQYTATGSYSDGSMKPVAGVTWSTSDSTVATISSAGLLTSLKPGSVNVTATSGAVSGKTGLTVGTATLVSISVAPMSAIIPPTQTQQFTATGNYTDGSTMDLTGSVGWTSSTPTIASVSSSGLAMGIAPGSTMIQAASGSTQGSVTLTVTAPVPGFTYSMNATFASGGMNPRGIVMADFNGDGKTDIAVANSDTNTLAVFLNDGTGNFGTPIVTTLSALSPLGPLEAGDFNEDGKADLILGTIGGVNQATYVLLGNGDGTFQAPAEIPNSAGFLSAVVKDINGDGHLDLIVGQGGGTAVFLGNGDGTFTGAAPLATADMGGFFSGVAVADFNHDGKLDIVGVDASTQPVGTLVFYPGNGDGTFGNPTTSPLDSFQPVSIAAADFNGDGKQDILVGYTSTVEIFFGNGDGTFNLTSPLDIGGNSVQNTGGIQVLAADVDQNGTVDAVLSDNTTGKLQIILNSAFDNAGPGTFTFSLSPGLFTPVAGDLNGDGLLDVAVINSTTNQVTVILSQKTQ
jgi:VCBS repeat protein/Big-like domain-containing protein